MKPKGFAKPDSLVAELLLELASSDRRRIFAELGRTSLKLNEITKRLDMTPTEAFRQIHRLTEARLLDKATDGRYSLTSYAKLVLTTTSPLEFIFRFRDYFLEHDATLIPSEFRSRFGELSSARAIPSAMETLNYVTELLRNARAFIDGTVELGFDLHQRLMLERLTEGVQVRWLVQESFLPTLRTMFRGSGKAPEVRLIPQLSGHIYLTENGGAFALRRNDGKMTYESFVGEDQGFKKWVSDWFTCEWLRAKPWPERIASES